MDIITDGILTGANYANRVYLYPIDNSTRDKFVGQAAGMIADDPELVYT